MDAKVENKEEKTCECNECNCEEECKCDEECTCEKEQKKEKKKDKYKKQIQELEEKIKGYEEKSLRDKAEMINYRRRKEEETSKMLKYCNEDLIKQLLPVIDNFERGLEAVSEEEKDSAFVKGIEQIYKQFVAVMEDVGVTPMDAQGKEFDANLHNAVMHVEDDEFGENIVAEELQKGYMYKENVLRHSMVKVAN